MTRVTLEIYDDIVTALNKIRDINDSGIEIEIPEGSILFENILNLKLIKHQLEKFGKTINFETTDEIGNNMLEILDEKTSAQNSTMEYQENQPTEIVTKSNNKSKNSFKKILPAFAFKLPKFELGNIALPIIVGILVPALIFGYLYFQNGNKTATAKVIVKAQPLTRSITIKVKSGSITTPETKTLNGIKVTSSLESTKEAKTTGEKIIGEKATGSVKIFNKTSTSKDFKKGTIVTYSRDKKSDLFFAIKEGITVPPAAPQDPLDPASVIVPGNATVNVEADTVGADYNIEKDSTLNVKGTKTSEFGAAALVDFTGGKSEKVTVVAAADLTNLTLALTTEINTLAETSFTAKIGKSQKLIPGSTKTTKVSETFTKKVGDTADTVSCTQAVQTEGLTYMESDINRLLDALVKDYVPEGFVLSNKERTTNVEILGNSSSSVLNSEEADLQVTLKTYVVPEITEDTIKEALKGKTTAEAEVYLGGIRNIVTFDFKMNKSMLPFLNKVPTNPDKIFVTIERQ